MSNQRQIVEFTIHYEIENWFKKRIYQTFESDVQLRYLSNDGHFSMHTRVEISTSENKINDVIEFVENMYDLLKSKMPWLNGNVYYVIYPAVMDKVEKKFKRVLEKTDYTINTYQIVGCPLKLFTFRPDLHHKEKIDIDGIFKISLNPNSLFMTYPKRSVAQKQSSFHFGIQMLRGYHGSYLKHLSLEDILSLEIVNNGDNSGPDRHLHHDIQMFLRSNYPNLYEGERLDYIDFKQFRISEVIRYFILKYHNRFQEISISNILTTDDILLLSQSYNIDISSNKLIHIDFKTANKPDFVDFCVIFHYDPKDLYFLNYDTKYTKENHVAYFNADDSLEPLKFNTEFSTLVIKSENSCSQQKLNSVLKCVTEHFRASQNNTPYLILFEFDLNNVSRQFLGSLLKIIGHGVLLFHKMNFNYETLKGIIEQSTENSIRFFDCHISIENVDVIPINSYKSHLQFHNMNVDLNLLGSLVNLKYLFLVNCRILSTNWDVPTITEIFGSIQIEQTNFDVATLLRLLYGLRCVPLLHFDSCEFTAGGELVEKKYFILRNQIQFTNISFKVQTLFQIFESCVIEKRMFFTNCHFRLEPNEPNKFSLKSVEIQFCNIKFDLPILLDILGSLNVESEVYIVNSSVLPWDDYFASSKFVNVRYIHFENCRLETNSLLTILAKISKENFVFLERCDLSQSNAADTTSLTNISEMHIEFKNMTIESQFARIILRTNSKVTFDNCCLTFMPDELSNISIQSYVMCKNMTLDSPSQLHFLANCTAESQIFFLNCNFVFRNLEISNIVIKPYLISFEKTSLDLEVLLKIMTKISENTEVSIGTCVIRTIDPKLHIPPIKIKKIRFSNMSLQIETILCLLKDFTNLELVDFKNCKIICTNRDHLSDITIKTLNKSFEDMNIDVQVWLTLVLKCSMSMNVRVTNCEIKSPQLSNDLINIKSLIFKNVTYSPSVLQFVQCLNGNCTITYEDRLSNQAIIEICTKSPFHGMRLILFDQICTKSFYFELFAEFYRPKALNMELDSNAEYDLPTYLIPCFGPDINRIQYDWSKFKIKFVEVNDGIVKIEFLKNGKVIDLFSELNELPDDFDDCVVDYY